MKRLARSSARCQDRPLIGLVWDCGYAPALHGISRLNSCVSRLDLTFDMLVQKGDMNLTLFFHHPSNASLMIIRLAMNKLMPGELSNGRAYRPYR